MKNFSSGDNVLASNTNSIMKFLSNMAKNIVELEEFSSKGDYISNQGLNNNTTYDIPLACKKIIISVKVAHSTAESTANIQLIKGSLTTQIFQTKAWTGGPGVEAKVTFTWTGDELIVSDGEMTTGTAYYYK